MEDVCFNPKSLTCSTPLSEVAKLPPRPSWCDSEKSSPPDDNLIGLWISWAILKVSCFCFLLCYHRIMKVQIWIEDKLNRIADRINGEDNTGRSRPNAEEGRPEMNDNNAGENEEGDEEERNPMMNDNNAGENEEGDEEERNPMMNDNNAGENEEGDEEERNPMMNDNNAGENE